MHFLFMFTSCLALTGCIQNLAFYVRYIMVDASLRRVNLVEIFLFICMFLPRELWRMRTSTCQVCFTIIMIHSKPSQL